MDLIGRSAYLEHRRKILGVSDVFGAKLFILIMVDSSPRQFDKHPLAEFCSVSRDPTLLNHSVYTQYL